MLQLNFTSILEPSPGKEWQKLFKKHWPAYKAWFESKGAVNKPNLKIAQAKLEEYMPEWMPTYHKFCELAGNDEIAARFLTGYQPPAYITGCSQVITQKEPQLVRNYDYHPNLSEGTLLNTAWNGKHVMAIGDCLCGVVDGMNSDGLVASLTFGGRKVVGQGFGIPFILRYVLEFCSDVQEGIEALQKIPTHMAYNVMLLDKIGAFKMLQLAPDHKPVLTDMPVSTNHQGEIDWPEHARFSKTVEREKFLFEALEENQDNEKIAEAFLKKPLFNRRYNEGFGTIYTSVYRPKEGYMELRWPENVLKQSFNDFEEGELLITYSEREAQAATRHVPTEFAQESYSSEKSYDWEKWTSNEPGELAQQVIKTISEAMGASADPMIQKVMEDMQKETKKRGQIPWEIMADLWSNMGRIYSNENSSDRNG